MRDIFDVQNHYFVEVTAYVLLVFACENLQNKIFRIDDILSISEPFVRFFWFDVEKILKDKHYIEPLNSSESVSEYEITSTGRSFANSYRVQNTIDLNMDPAYIIMRIYNK